MRIVTSLMLLQHILVEAHHNIIVVGFVEASAKSTFVKLHDITKNSLCIECDFCLGQPLTTKIALLQLKYNKSYRKGISSAVHWRGNKSMFTY